MSRSRGSRVLEVRKRVLGEEHPDTLAAMRHLKVVLDTQREHLGADA